MGHQTATDIKIGDPHVCFLMPGFRSSFCIKVCTLIKSEVSPSVHQDYKSITQCPPVAPVPRGANSIFAIGFHFSYFSLDVCFP